MYHLADATHVHLVCDGCGTITELPRELVDALAAQLHAGFGFQAAFHHFSIGGKCQNCATGPKRRTAKDRQRRMSADASAS